MSGFLKVRDKKGAADLVSVVQSLAEKASGNRAGDASVMPANDTSIAVTPGGPSDPTGGTLDQTAPIPTTATPEASTTPPPVILPPTTKSHPPPPPVKTDTSTSTPPVETTPSDTPTVPPAPSSPPPPVVTPLSTDPITSSSPSALTTKAALKSVAVPVLSNSSSMAPNTIAPIADISTSFSTVKVSHTVEATTSQGATWQSTNTSTSAANDKSGDSGGGKSLFSLGLPIGLAVVAIAMVATIYTRRYLARLRRRRAEEAGQFEIKFEPEMSTTKDLDNDDNYSASGHSSSSLGHPRPIESPPESRAQQTQYFSAPAAPVWSNPAQHTWMQQPYQPAGWAGVGTVPAAKPLPTAPAQYAQRPVVTRAPSSCQSQMAVSEMPTDAASTNSDLNPGEDPFAPRVTFAPLPSRSLPSRSTSSASSHHFSTIKPHRAPSMSSHGDRSVYSTPSGPRSTYAPPSEYLAETDWGRNPAYSSFDGPVFADWRASQSTASTAPSRKVLRSSFGTEGVRPYEVSD